MTEKHISYTHSMITICASDRLRLLVDFLLNFPTREQIVVHLSENICPKGEIAGVSTGRLDDSGNINFDFFHGFSVSHPQDLTVRITDDDPSAETLRSMKTKVINLHTIYDEFSEAMALPGITDYGTGLGFPATSRRLYVFAFVGENENFEDFMEYFECIRSILTFWETLEESKAIKQMSRPELRDKALTSRQARILEMISDGKTNATIATHLGYSESLIRQETIIIYRKLGVDGRRELKRDMAS